MASTTVSDILLLLFIVWLAIVLLDNHRAEVNWVKHASVYQIYVRSFKDSNNDGIGDLQGIISKLDFLQELGIDAIWLSPIYPSPMVDAGYDISDFTDINPDFGTLEDFDELVKKANASGIRIIMDFVPNHTSNKHKWFLYSENRTEGYEDWYVWRDSNKDGGPPNNWLSVFKYSAWKYSETRGQWYLHQFAPEQPDLNYRNPAVVQAMKDVLVFWMDRGVSGFRVDAVAHLFENADFPDEPLADNPGTDENSYGYLDHIYSRNLIETYWMVYDWRKLLDNYTISNQREKMIMMTEAWENTDLTMMYYGNSTNDGATFPFNFKLITDISTNTNAMELVNILRDWLDNMPEGRVPNWVLGNHDQHRAASRFGKDRVDGYNIITRLLPGTTLTYNGEEIGMENGEVTWEQGQDPSACNGDKETFSYISRDFERTPYQWDNTTNAGFNGGAKTWLPVSEKYLTCNLQEQRYPENKRSHYHVYVNATALRKSEPFVSGNVTIEAVSENVIAFTRQLNGYDTYVVLFNLKEDAVEIDLTEKFTNLSIILQIEVVSVNSSKRIGEIINGTSLKLNGYESLVARAGSDV